MVSLPERREDYSWSLWLHSLSLTTFSNVGRHMHVYMPKMCVFANARAGMNVYMLMHIRMKTCTCR